MTTDRSRQRQRARLAVIFVVAEDEAIAAVEGNLWSMWSAFGRGEGCRLVDEPGLLRFETPLGHTPYNSVMRFRCNDRVDEMIDSVMGSYEQREVPVMWVVHPTTQPADIHERLVARGLVEAEIVPGMVARLGDIPSEDPAPAEVEIAPVTPQERDSFLELTAWRYSLPTGAAPTLRSILETARFGEPGAATLGWVARLDGAVVSKVVLHMNAGVAGIYGVATKPEARGLGLARTLTLCALHAARRSGVEIAVLHSTPMARRLYEGIGFRTVADLVLYSTPDSLHL
ncbi:MAG TPA: GNAT family N-acetyltransferase [Acidimicrobiales bacterium]|nr:GNAT family N-acetyltransferase [Acidimicrobiales bacterium]